MASLMGYAFKRTDIPKKQRKPTFVFLDECQNFMTDSVITILAEARKYALHLVLANQYLDQLKDERKSALKSNANVKVVGVNDKDHFRKMASSMGVGHDELSKLPNYHFYVKVRGKKPYKLKTADFLIKNRYYTLGKEEKKKLDRRVLYDSGYYRKIRPNGKPLNARSTTKKEVHPPPRNRQFRFHNM